MIKKHWNIGLGLVFFLLAILFLIFLAAPLQYELGLLGMGLTEIGLLALALIGGLLLKGGFKENFPFKRPRFADFRGSAYIYIGAYCFTIGIASVMSHLFPGMNEVSGALNEFFSEGGWLLVVTVSLMPGVCEEFLFRGLIQSSFRGVQNTAVRVAAVSILFGLFHLDMYRFLPTMILGVGLTYMMLKTGNLRYPIFFHALNNLISILPILLNALPEDAAETAATFMNAPTLVGMVMLFFSVGLLFVWLGVRRLNGKAVNDGGWKAKRIAFLAACIALAFTGCAVMGAGVVMQEMGTVFESKITITLEEEYVHEEDFEVLTAGTYQFSLYAKGESARGSVRIVDQYGGEVCDYSGTDLTVSGPRHLEKGTYTCFLTLTPLETGEIAEAKIGVLIKR